jgi:outer membrane protein TolC
LLALSACARYQSQPLSSEAIERQLATPAEPALRVAATQLHHPILQLLPIELTQPLSPQQAGVLAVILNPELRAERDRRNLAAAQLLQAGLLPNPQFVGGVEFPYDSSPPDDFTAYNAGIEWEITTALIGRREKRRAAAAEAASVDLDVAWKEWQIAQEATAAAYDVIALDARVRAAREADRQLAENLALVRRAVDRHEKTLLDLATAEASALDARVTLMTEQREAAHQRLVLNRSLGLPPDRPVRLTSDENLPSRLDAPSIDRLLSGLQDRRLDLLALKRGYESQDATLRAAILAQFPRITLGLTAARDTSNVKTIGVGATIDLPLFDRNQGVIATETATRQRLFDEYAARVFAARSDLATAIADIQSTNAQIAATESAIPGLERLEQTYRTALAQGNVDVVGLYGIQSNLWAKRLDLIKLKQQLAANWVALEIASGQHLPMRPPGTSKPTTQEANP